MIAQLNAVNYRASQLTFAWAIAAWRSELVASVGGKIEREKKRTGSSACRSGEFLILLLFGNLDLAG